MRWLETPSDDLKTATKTHQTDWIRVIPFAALHLMCLAVIWVGWSWTAVFAAILFYFLRMMALSGFYHRYFSHRTYKTSRAGQFVFAVLGCTCVQKGPLWWSAHHRHHHTVSDTSEDVHSPVRYGFLWSHMGWFFSKANFRTDVTRVGDLAKYPELRFLDRFDLVAPMLFAAVVWELGVILESVAPALGTNGPQMLVWGFLISTVVLYHGTYTINSLSHMIGRRRYQTGDESRNNAFLAFITCGEWHNNHHYHPASTRLGFFWWEIDITYYALLVLSWFGVIWDVKTIPKHLLKLPRA
jgi:stearoyl-CoA desaturase (delta-9 desaturase)